MIVLSSFFVTFIPRNASTSPSSVNSKLSLSEVIIISIVAVLVIAVGALIFFLPGEQIARLASDQVKEQFGRDLTIEGDVQLSFFPTLGISTGPVTLANASWSSNGPMFQAQGAKIGVDAMTSTHAIFDLTDPAPAFGVYLNFFLKRVRRSERYELLPEPAV